MGASLLCSYNVTVDAHRCSPPSKGNDYQKIYSDWCHEFEKYKSAMKTWEKKQTVCPLYFPSENLVKMRFVPAMWDTTELKQQPKQPPKWDIPTSSVIAYSTRSSFTDLFRNPFIVDSRVICVNRFKNGTIFFLDFDNIKVWQLISSKFY